MLSRRVHVKRTIFRSLSLNPLMSGCLSATAQAILRVAHAWVALAASLQHGHRAPRWSSPRLPLRRLSSSSRRVFSSVAAPCGARERRARGRRAPVVGVVRCVGIAAWGSSWPQAEEPRGRAAGAQKSRRSSAAAHPGNHQFPPCFLSRRIPRPHQRLKWTMAVVVSVQSAPATEMAALVSVMMMN